MQKFMKNYPQYVELLTENDYVLSLPTSQVLQTCILDDMFILDHILQSSYDNKEFTTLNGKTYTIKDKRLELQSDPNVRVEILQNDVWKLRAKTKRRSMPTKKSSKNTPKAGNLMRCSGGSMKLPTVFSPANGSSFGTLYRCIPQWTKRQNFTTKL